MQVKRNLHRQSAAQQSLAAEGAPECFSSNLIPFSLDAGREPQLKPDVGRASDGLGADH